MENIRIVYFGTPAFAATVLETLIAEGYSVSAIVTQPDKPVGRKHILTACPVKETALKYSIPVLQPVRLKEEYESVLSYQPDLVLTCAYGQIIPSQILSCPKYGSLNIHPSPLPKYRGGAPIQRAIMHGDKTTQICLMEMVQKMDAGKVYARKNVEILDDETGSELFERLAKESASFIKEVLPKYLSGQLKGEAQDESKVILAPNIDRKEEEVSFQKEALPDLYNHIRALTSVPGAYAMCNGKRIKFFKTRMEQKECNEVPGTILGFHENAIAIACKGGILKIYELQMEGKNRMDAKSFANGLLPSLLKEKLD